jgi:hypothetical protein
MAIDQLQFQQSVLNDTEAQFAGDVETKYVELREQAAAPALPTDKASALVYALAADHSVVIKLSTGQVVGLSTALPVRVASAAIDMKAVANTGIVLTGLAAQHFVPRSVVFLCTTVGGAGLNGDITVSLGTTAGGAEIAAAAPLTGLNTAYEAFRWDLTGVFPAILGNATFYVNVTIADTGAGTGSMVAYVEGDII